LSKNDHSRIIRIRFQSIPGTPVHDFQTTLGVREIPEFIEFIAAPPVGIELLVASLLTCSGDNFLGE
jgi:hypothetical protein